MEKGKIVVRREPQRISIWAVNPNGRTALMYEFRFDLDDVEFANRRARLIGGILDVDVEELR